MQVDFYQLSRDPVHHVVPAIARRVLDSGARLLVVDSRDGALDRMSQALWDAGPASFLAHGKADGDLPEVQPILLATDCAAANGARHIALADGLWREQALSFDRVFYFFDADTIDSARGTWRALKGRDEVEPRFWRQEGRRWVQGP
jgi:DNA polymerase III subunit chi